MIVAEFLMVSDGAHEIETLWRVLQTSKRTFNKIDILRIDGIRCRAVWKEQPTESDQTILEESWAACCPMDSRKTLLLGQVMGIGEIRQTFRRSITYVHSTDIGCHRGCALHPQPDDRHREFVVYFLCRSLALFQRQRN